MVRGPTPAAAIVEKTFHKVPIAQLPSWAQKHTTAQDLLVLEASGNSFEVVRMLAAVVLEDDRGTELVEHLLKNPPIEPLHASVIEQLVDGVPLADRGVALDMDDHSAGHDGGNGESPLGGVVEERAGKKLMGAMTLPALKNRVAELKRDMADDALPEEEREAAKKEFQDLVRAYSKGGKMGGRGRAGAYGKPGCFTYVPPDGVVWKD